MTLNLSTRALRVQALGARALGAYGRPDRAMAKRAISKPAQSNRAQSSGAPWTANSTAVRPPTPTATPARPPCGRLRLQWQVAPEGGALVQLWSDDPARWFAPASLVPWGLGARPSRARAPSWPRRSAARPSA